MRIDFEVDEQLIQDREIVVTDLNSELWAMYRSACGMIWDEINIIWNELQGSTPEDVNFEDIFENLCEKLTHQMSFYDASYLALPYLLKLYDKKVEEQDFEWQLRLLCAMGMIVMTDISGLHDSDRVAPELVKNFQNCVVVLAEKTKKFIVKYQDLLAELDDNTKSYFYVMALAILDDRRAAYVLTSCCFSEIYAVCDECDMWNEEMAMISDEEIEEIEPAKPVIGHWDGKSLADTYQWYSNFLYILGDEEAAKALSYYYGVYTCPECGKKGVAMEFAKRYFDL